MKKSCLLFVFLIIMFSLTTLTLASGDYIILLDTVNIRKGPGVNNAKLGLGKNGARYDVISPNIVPDEKNDGTCDAGWYEISYDGGSAYVCSEYARLYQEVIPEEPVDPNNECETEMASAGFPASYWGGLCALKKVHPTWHFQAINTGLDWSTAVEKESSCGKSLLQTSNENFIDNSCKKGYGTWKPASQKALAFYMDPRNFLTEQYIFQFEYLKYDKKLSTSYINSSNSMLASAAFYKYHNNLGNNLGSITNSAGSETNVNPVFLSARMRQELGTGTTLYNLYSGVYTENNRLYYGYYNFYNIGVSDECATTSGTSYCGLSYAYKKGWNSVFNAIKGGSNTLSQNYISVGQYSTYLQKFNVVPDKLSNLYIHQYMTNIAAPSSESKTTYNTYKKLNLLDTAFSFHIPVYANMDSDIDNSDNGATEEPDDSEKPSSVPISTIIASAGYKSTSTYISGIKPKTNVTDFKGSLESVAGTNAVSVMTHDGKPKNEGVIGTGDVVKITNATESKNFVIIIKGDTSGDGVINALDLLQIQKNILKTYNLNDAYARAGDTSGDGVINALDLLQVQKNILGTYKIKQ